MKNPSAHKPYARTRSWSPPSRLLGIRRIHRHGRNEAIPVRHLDLRQTLVVQDLVLLDDAVAIEQKRDQGVDLVMGERSRLAGGHRAVDIIPRDGRDRVVAHTVLVLIAESALM